MTGISESWKEVFYREITKIHNGGRYKVITQKQYEEIMEELSEARTNYNRKTSSQYRELKRFEVLQIAGIKKLIAKRANVKDENFKFYVTAEKLYDVIEAAHEASGHGGRDRVVKETSLKYANVTRESIRLFLSMCETCQQKKKK